MLEQAQRGRTIPPKRLTHIEACDDLRKDVGFSDTQTFTQGDVALQLIANSHRGRMDRGIWIVPDGITLYPW
jgi:hypothetical protein